ncbi:MAG: CCA tRNA nucleotidyltransferase [Clostridiales bacterium]|nr:CCA tRNA nucleotidyltransferase [Clostridiales bacterium]
MKLNKDVIYILNSLQEAGFEGFVVGGCVRDYLMGLDPHDYDITTNALPTDSKKIFPRTVDTGIKHGTVTVLVGKRSYEVTTYRIDGEYKDSRHPEEVIFVQDIEKDLSRRDFCMNAIAYSPKEGYIDPFGGRNDIKSGIIKGVGDPNLRFNEDALRMLRAVRFSAQLGFKIEENTYDALKKNAELIKNVSMERVAAELLRLLCSSHCEKAELLCSANLGDYCVPEITEALRKRGAEIIPVLKNANKNGYNNEEIALAAVLARDPDPLKALKDLKLSNRLIDNVTALIKYYDFNLKTGEYELRRLYSLLGELVFELLNLKEAKGEDISKAFEFLKGEKRLTKKDLCVNGRDLMSLGLKGRQIGVAEEGLLDMILSNPNLNEKDILLKEALKWLR